MQAQLRRPAPNRERMAALGRSNAATNGVAIAVLAVWCAALLYYLLARFPYDGLYGQDSYAYYYQSRALLQDMTGQPPQAWQLFSSDRLYHWPIGYHLHLILGQIISGSVAGGRAITLFMAVGAAVVLYLLMGELWPTAARRERILSGLVAGAALPLVATYTRMGLSLMSDVPALFWGLLGIYCCLRAFRVLSTEYRGQSGGEQARSRYWLLAGGLALGIAVLTRYASVLFLIPLGVYFLIHRLRRAPSTEHEGDDGRPADTRYSVLGTGCLLWMAAGFAIGVLPQIVYLLVYKVAGTGYADWLSGWSPANFLSTTVTGPDGTSTFAQPMIVFYLLQPFYDSDAGFLSRFYLPALIMGLAVLAWERSWAVVGLLLSWWIVPVLFFAGTAYQAHRFALVYLPVLLVLVGIGAASAIRLGVAALRGGASGKRVLYGSLAAVILLGLAAGAYKEQGSVKGWMAIHESFKVEEQRVLALARKAAGTYNNINPPRVVAFGLTSALYHYTQWPVIELFNSDESVVARFLDAPGPHLLVLPEASMSTQWANTPLAARWLWIKETYTLASQGMAGEYTVYTIGDRR